MVTIQCLTIIDPEVTTNGIDRTMIEEAETLREHGKMKDQDMVDHNSPVVLHGMTENTWTGIAER